jgi:MFS family permease
MRLWRYCLGGLLYDWLVYVFWTVVPIRAEGFGASSTQLALLQTSSTAVYVLSCLYMGRLSDRVSRSLLARAGCLGALGACLLTAKMGSLNGLYLAVPILGFAASIYWPNVQGAIGAETDPAEMERALGLFNVTWSLGKAAGFAMAGWLAARAGLEVTLFIAASAALPILLFYPGNSGARPARLQGEARVDRAAYLPMGYVANFIAFGVGTCFQNQFYKYLEDGGLGTIWKRETFFGLFLGVMFAAQTVMFFVLQRGRGWTYRRGLLYGSQAVVAAASVGITLFRNDWGILALAPLVGLGLGFAYASSIYYSLHGPSEHGKFAGLHEAVLGAGTFIVPLAGGWLADRTHDLRMPYWLAAAATVAAIGLEEGIYRRSSRS